MGETMSKVDFKNKWVIAILALFGVSLISAGVFASASISLNSGGVVNLGAGSAAVSACDSYATVSTAQTYNSTAQRYELTTITLSNVDTTGCNGKTLAMAFKTSGGTTYSTTWGISGMSGEQTLTWGGTAGTGNTSYSALTPIDTANSGISTIAISAQ
jgi:hypothetical protein